MIKVGDRVRVMKEGLCGTNEVPGAILTVINVDEKSGIFRTNVTDTPGETWRFHLDVLGPELERVTIGLLPSSRKDTPVFSGVLMYFPDAIKAIAQHSAAGNRKHNPGQPLHWSKEKSKDHADCIARHLIDIGPTWDALDEETKSLHAQALAWRALALLQTILERPKAKGEVLLIPAKCTLPPGETL